jgi:hypothetical protein
VQISGTCESARPIHRIADRIAERIVHSRDRIVRAITSDPEIASLADERVVKSNAMK